MPCKRHKNTHGVKCAACILANERERGGETLLTSLARNPHLVTRQQHFYTYAEIRAERARLGLDPNVSFDVDTFEQRPIEQRPIEQRPIEQRPIEQRPIVLQRPIEQRPIEQRPMRAEFQQRPMRPVAMQRPVKKVHKKKKTHHHRAKDTDRLLAPPPRRKQAPTLRPRGSGVRAPARCVDEHGHSWGDGICQRCGFNSNAFAHIHAGPVLRRQASEEGRKLFQHALDESSSDSDSDSD